MIAEWYIAKRYLRPRRRGGFLSFITVITVVGVMLGTAALIITLSVLDGFERDIREKVIGFTSHIEVRGFQNMPLQHYRSGMERVMKEVRGVRVIAPFAAREGMIRSHDGVDGIFLKGIDPHEDILRSRSHIIRGSFVGAADSGMPGIVIGRKLADRLNVDLGATLVVFALPGERSAAIQPHAMQFRLKGIYETGMAEFDDVYAYASLPAAQQLFQLGDAVTGYDLLVDDLARVDSIAEGVQEVLGYPHFARTVFQMYRNLFSWVELQKKLSPVLLSLIIIVATVNIVGTLLMFVLEKTHAIGVLKSLGAGPGFIRRVFTLQGLLIACSGAALGNVLAYVCCWIQLTFRVISIPADIYYMDTVPILLRAPNFIGVTVVVIALCLLTSILPSRAAARLDAVAALRFG